MMVARCLELPSLDGSSCVATGEGRGSVRSSARAGVEVSAGVVGGAAGPMLPSSDG